MGRAPALMALWSLGSGHVWVATGQDSAVMYGMGTASDE